MSEKDKTGESGPDFTHYNELLQQARTKDDEVTRPVAGQFVPLLYAELIILGLSPFNARLRIVEDCVPMWAEVSILHLLPPEAKEGARRIGGLKSGEVRKARSVIEREYEVLLDHVSIAQILGAQMASTDGKVRLTLNSKHAFKKVEPVTQKSVTTEPLTVKSSTAPIRST
jgi:hypothetical protein